VKARTFILTTGAALALVVPAAQATNSSNRLFQTKVHTILAERNTHQSTKTAKTSHYAKAEAGYYQALLHTVGADGNLGPVGLSRPSAADRTPMPPQSPASSRR
jgi:hypothetical protein